MSKTGTRGNLDSIDPVSLAAPVRAWNNSFRNDSAATSIATVTVDDSASSSDRKTLVITATADQLRREKNFYDGATLYLSNVRRRITYYEYISDDGGSGNGDVAVIKVDTALTDAAYVNCTIENPTLPTNLGPYGLVFVPQGEDVDNFYNGMILENMDTGTGDPETATILAYDGTTHMARIATTVADWSSANFNFTIRRAPRTDYGHFEVCASRAIQLDITDAAERSDAYTGGFVRILSGPPTAPTFSTPTAPYGESRKITRYVALDSTMASNVAAAQSTFVLSSNASTTDSKYVGCYMTVAGGSTYLITAYTGSTRTGTISGTFPFPHTAGDAVVIRTAFLQTAFSVDPVAGVGTNYEILQFSYDNFVPMAWNESVVSQQEAVLYEVKLLSLCLPNLVLDVQGGGRPCSYPCVYVRFDNANSGTKNAIMSNNPLSARQTFEVPVTDTTIIQNAQFIKLKCDMVQYLRIRPCENLRFSVYLNTGELFKVEMAEDYGPLAPNYQTQITAMFSIRRV